MGRVLHVHVAVGHLHCISHVELWCLGGLGMLISFIYKCVIWSVRWLEVNGLFVVQVGSLDPCECLLCVCFVHVDNRCGDISISCFVNKHTNLGVGVLLARIRFLDGTSCIRCIIVLGVVCLIYLWLPKTTWCLVMNLSPSSKGESGTVPISPCLVGIGSLGNTNGHFIHASPYKRDRSFYISIYLSDEFVHLRSICRRMWICVLRPRVFVRCGISSCICRLHIYPLCSFVKIPLNQ